MLIPIPQLGKLRPGVLKSLFQRRTGDEWCRWDQSPHLLPHPTAPGPPFSMCLDCPESHIFVDRGRPKSTVFSFPLFQQLEASPRPPRRKGSSPPETKKTPLGKVSRGLGISGHQAEPKMAVASVKPWSVSWLQNIPRHPVTDGVFSPTSPLNPKELFRLQIKIC